jgi:hypothetical protein
MLLTRGMAVRDRPSVVSKSFPKLLELPTEFIDGLWYRPLWQLVANAFLSFKNHPPPAKNTTT